MRERILYAPIHGDAPASLVYSFGSATGDSNMRTIILVAAVIGLAGTATAQRYTQGYVRPNGTYVAPHYSSAPNNTRVDNWSSRGNVNPYTGQVGTRDPYRPAYTPLRPLTSPRRRGF